MTEFKTPVTVNIIIFWEMAPCSRVEICRIFDGTIGIYPEDGNIMCLRNVTLFIRSFILSFIHSFRILSYDRPIAS